MVAEIGFGAYYPSSCPLTPVEFAQKIESLGFDGFWMGENPTNRGPRFDTLTVLSQAAAVTSRITVGSDVLLTPLHHPAWLAKAIGSLDVLSNGRVIPTLGVGGEYAKQFELFGVPVAERGRRTDEAIDVLRELWTKDVAAFDGRFFKFSDIVMEPRPVQSPCPPIWIGGRPGGRELAPDGTMRFKSKLGAIRRAALRGDGWCPYYMTPEMYRDSVQAITQLSADAGRDISHMSWALTTFWLMADSYDAALDTARKKQRYERDLSDRVSRYDILGSPRDTIRRLEQFVNAGVRYFVCNWSCDSADVPWHLEAIAADVIPHFR